MRLRHQQFDSVDGAKELDELLDHNVFAIGHLVATNGLA